MDEEFLSRMRKVMKVFFFILFMASILVFVVKDSIIALSAFPFFLNNFCFESKF